MTDLKDRITTAQWVFERQLAWIAAAEVKVGVIVAIETALLGGLAAAFVSSDHLTRPGWAYLLSLSAAGLAVMAIFCAAMAMLPRVSGPEDSLLFFGRVRDVSIPDYQLRFKSILPDELLDDWTAQIHRNSEIAWSKYGWVAKSVRWAFASAVPWVAAVGLLVKV